MEGPYSKFSFFSNLIWLPLMPLPFPCKIVFPFVQTPFGLLLPFLQILSATTGALSEFSVILLLSLAQRISIFYIFALLLLSLSFVHFTFYIIKDRLK